MDRDTRLASRVSLSTDIAHIFSQKILNTERKLQSAMKSLDSNVGYQEYAMREPSKRECVQCFQVEEESLSDFHFNANGKKLGPRYDFKHTIINESLLLAYRQKLENLCIELTTFNVNGIRDIFMRRRRNIHLAFTSISEFSMRKHAKAQYNKNDAPSILKKDFGLCLYTTINLENYSLPHSLFSPMQIRKKVVPEAPRCALHKTNVSADEILSRKRHKLCDLLNELHTSIHSYTASSSNSSLVQENSKVVSKNLRNAVDKIKLVIESDTRLLTEISQQVTTKNKSHEKSVRPTFIAKQVMKNTRGFSVHGFTDASCDINEKPGDFTSSSEEQLKAELLQIQNLNVGSEFPLFRTNAETCSGIIQAIDGLKVNSSDRSFHKYEYPFSNTIRKMLECLKKHVEACHRFLVDIDIIRTKLLEKDHFIQKKINNLSNKINHLNVLKSADIYRKTSLEESQECVLKDTSASSDNLRTKLAYYESVLRTMALEVENGYASKPLITQIGSYA